MTSINFQELLEEAGPTGDLPDGTYDAECTQAEAKMASTGKPMIVARFRVISGAHVNRVIVNNFVISQGSQNALRWFFQHMAVFDMSREFFQTPGLQLEQVAGNIMGKVCRLTLATKEGRQNVGNVSKLPGAAAGVPAAQPQVYTPPAAQQPQVVPQYLSQQFAAQPIATQQQMQEAQPAPAILQAQQPQPQVVQPQPEPQQLPADHGVAGQALAAAGAGVDQWAAQTPPEQQPIQYTQVGVPQENGATQQPAAAADAPPQIPF